jgi:hypothetical protein
MADSVTLEQYWVMLNNHDWYYNYSDDPSVWRRGSNNEAKMVGTSKQSPEHEALYKGFVAHHFSGDPWKTEKQPKPERPTT